MVSAALHLAGLSPLTRSREGDGEGEGEGEWSSSGLFLLETVPIRMASPLAEVLPLPYQWQASRLTSEGANKLVQPIHIHPLATGDMLTLCPP